MTTLERAQERAKRFVEDNSDRIKGNTEFMASLITTEFMMLLVDEIADKLKNETKP
jgi:hypothetical protein